MFCKTCEHYNLHKRMCNRRRMLILKSNPACDKYEPNYTKDGLCTWCRKENDRPGKTICSSCAIMAKEKQLLKRKERIDQGLCETCGSPSVPGKTRCEVCICKQRIARKKYYDKQRLSQVKKEY